MSRRRRGAGATRSLATGAKMHVRVTRQRRHKHQQSLHDSSALYVPSDALPAFSAVSDPQKPAATTGSHSTEPTAASSSYEKEPQDDDTSESTVSEDSDTEEQEETSEAADGGVMMTTTFPSQPFARFEVTIEKRSERHLTITFRNIKTNEKWESEPAQLCDFVTDTNRIPMATLNDYIKVRHRHLLEFIRTNRYYKLCFKDALQGPRAAPVNLVPAFYDAENTTMRLEISLRVRVSSMQWLAKFEFHLLRIKQDKDESKLELSKVQTRLQAQETEIETLKQQVAKLVSNEKDANNQAQKKNNQAQKKEMPKYAVYFRASSVFAATRDEVIDWYTERTNDAFHNAKDSVSTLVRFTRSGLFAVLVVMHHSNCEDESKAFQLQLNGECVQSCFASNADGMRQTSSLMHFVHAKADDKLAVKYRGSGSAEAGSFIEVNLME